MLQIESCAKKQIQINDLSKKKGVCSDLNRLAQLLQMAAGKSLETMSGMILDLLQPKFAAKSASNEMLCLKAM